MASWVPESTVESLISSVLCAMGANLVGTTGSSNGSNVGKRIDISDPRMRKEDGIFEMLSCVPRESRAEGSLLFLRGE